MANVRKRIIWSLDAFEATERKDLYAHVVETLRRVQKRLNAEIEPVYVLSPAELNLSMEMASPWIGEYKPAAERAMAKMLEGVELPGLLPPHVITQELSSTTRSVELLSNYAEMQNAEMIVLSTHGRRGMSRLLLGSFAETLLLHCKVPVLVVGPHIEKVNEFEHILFPTEFGEHSRETLRYVVDMAKTMGARMTLFHSIPHPIEPVFQSGVYLFSGTWMPIQDYFNQEVDRQERRAKAWAKWAINQGVMTDYEIHTGGGGVVQALLSAAKSKQTGFIAMEAQSGPIASVLLGSIARQVVRGATCPVWLIRWTNLSSLRRAA